MTTFIAIDHSLTATGLAVWRNRRIWVTTIKTTKPREDAHGWGNAPRHQKIAAEVLSYVEPGDTCSAIEGQIKYQGHGTADLDLAALRAVLVYRLAARRVPVASPHLTHVKVYATGKGNASKDDVVSAARTHGFAPKNDNEADAVWILTMMLDAYRKPIVRMPDRNRAAIAKTTWPVFIPEPSGAGTEEKGDH